MKKYTLILSILILVSSCVSTKNANTKTLKLTKAVSQTFVLGVEARNGKTSGKTYSMYFESKGDVVVEKVWINGMNIDFEQAATDANGSFRIRSTEYKKFKKNIHEKIKAPIEYTGEALVQYKENDETKYYVVSSFTKKDLVKGYK